MEHSHFLLSAMNLIELAFESLHSDLTREGWQTEAGVHAPRS